MNGTPPPPPPFPLKPDVSLKVIYVSILTRRTASIAPSPQCGRHAGRFDLSVQQVYRVLFATCDNVLLRTYTATY